ncbi:MAG TPA: hypothetical protein VK187_03425 [Geobacteraceae bacterium]|nr:hypothetical protein [Geobacteraceae bacterium]
MGANRLLVLLSLVLTTTAAGAEKALPPPDRDMLEFLGTFETSGGKDIDPFLLEGVPKKSAKPGKTVTRRPVTRPPVPKETPPKGREKYDE